MHQERTALGEWLARDCGGPFGTWRGDRRIAEDAAYRLEHGDTMRMGDSVCFCIVM